MSVSVRISDEAYKVCSQVANNSGIPLKRVIETAILEYYKEENTLPQRVAKIEDEIARLATRDALRQRIATNSRS